MTDKMPFPQLREQAIALRRAGNSLREIKATLAIGSNVTLSQAVRGEPPPAWTRRNRAKDDLHARARALRAEGATYNEIAAALSVSKSSVSLWVRDMPREGRLSYLEIRERNAAGVSSYWAAQRSVREARRHAGLTRAAAQIGVLSDRELLISGAIAYWCEGAKSKPHRRCDRVTFINSDAGLVQFFLRFLAAAGVAPDRLICRVYIHESADVDAAQRFWQGVTGLDAAQFRSPTLKHHNPKTVRKNTGPEYHGCLKIDVRRSSDLYRQVEGWAAASLTPPAKATGPSEPAMPT